MRAAADGGDAELGDMPVMSRTCVERRLRVWFGLWPLILRPVACPLVDMKPHKNP